MRTGTSLGVELASADSPRVPGGADLFLDEFGDPARVGKHFVEADRQRAIGEWNNRDPVEHRPLLDLSQPMSDFARTDRGAVAWGMRKASLALVSLLFVVGPGCSDDGGPDGSSDGGGGSTSDGGQGTGAGGSEPATTARECETDEDCSIVDDCCSCGAIPTEDVQDCPQECLQSTCSALGIMPAGVACAAGQCVFTNSCNAAQVTCDEAPPTCNAGSLPSVDGTCRGPCIGARDCLTVTSCEDCGELACVEVTGFTSQFQCVPVPAGLCEEGPRCGCIEDLCDEDMPCSDAESGITCSCLDC